MLTSALVRKHACTRPCTRPGLQADPPTSTMADGTRRQVRKRGWGLGAQRAFHQHVNAGGDLQPLGFCVVRRSGPGRWCAAAWRHPGRPDARARSLDHRAGGAELTRANLPFRYPVAGQPLARSTIAPRVPEHPDHHHELAALRRPTGQRPRRADPEPLRFPGRPGTVASARAPNPVDEHPARSPCLRWSAPVLTNRFANETERDRGGGPRR